MRCFKLSHWHVHFFINSKSLKQVTLSICRKKTNSWSNHTDCSHSPTKVDLWFSHRPVLLCSLVVCEANMSSYRQSVSRKAWVWPSDLKPFFRLLAPWWPAEQPPGHEHLEVMLPVFLHTAWVHCTRQKCRTPYSNIIKKNQDTMAKY